MTSRWMFIVAILVYLAVGCGRQTPTSAPETEAEAVERATSQAEPDGMTMRGIDLYMHRSTPREGVAGKPELWVRADRLTIGEANKYVFENARAVIYGKDDVEEVVIRAARGDFEQDARAVLEGDVYLTAGTLEMHLSDIEWRRPDDGAMGTAYSDSPVIVNDPNLQLTAAGLRLYPESQEFELTNVSGVVRFVEKLL